MKVFIVLLSLLVSLASWGQDIKIPPLRSPVMDEAHLMHPAQKRKLEDLIYQLYQKKGPQVTVLTVKDLQGLAIEDFSIRVAEAWQLGLKKQGNGLLLLISKDDRRVRIEVGEGIEGEITDFEANQMIRHYLVPSFRNNDYYTGVAKVILRVAEKFEISLTQGRMVSHSRANHRANSPLNLALPFMVIVLVAVHLLFNSKPLLRGIFSGAGIAGVSFFMAPVIGAGIIVVFIVGFLIGLIGLSNVLFAIAASSGRGRGGFGGGGFGGGGGWSGGGGGFSGGGSSGSW
ncbi:MAG TPA: TPM domain-containing protein [Bacteriovoracaceae bacterium]|nr:TPM domain-containing protein [Bacteriovoracaceae bacterium]